MRVRIMVLGRLEPLQEVTSNGTMVSITPLYGRGIEIWVNVADRDGRYVSFLSRLHVEPKVLYNNLQAVWKGKYDEPLEDGELTEVFEKQLSNYRHV